MASAWAAGDATAYAALFTEDAACEVREGLTLRGRAQVRDGHALAFSTTHAGSTLADQRVVSAARGASARELAVVAARAVVRRGGARKAYRVAMTLRDERGDGAWRVARFSALAPRGTGGAPAGEDGAFSPRGAGGGGGGAGWGALAAAALAAAVLVGAVAFARARRRD